MQDNVPEAMPKFLETWFEKFDHATQQRFSS
jgi:hypothetical protein